MRAALCLFGLALSMTAVSAAAGHDERLSLRVSPVVAIAPATVTVQARVDADDQNRALQVTVESDGFTRSSQIQLDGKNAPRVSVFELRDIPSGLYEVRAVLVGVSGPRASSLKLLKVAGAPGAAR